MANKVGNFKQSGFQSGFTLVELVSVLILVGVLSVTLSSRFTSSGAAKVQSARDDIIRALFFAQQTSMARPGIVLLVTGGAVSVEENGTPIIVDKYGYPLSFPSGITANVISFSYDKLGQTSAGTITVSETAGSASATISVQASGYAF